MPYLKWQVLLQYAVTSLRFWAGQNLNKALFFFFSPQETSFCFSHLICKSGQNNVLTNFWSTGNSWKGAVAQCHRPVSVNMMVMQRSQFGPCSSGPAATHIPCPGETILGRIYLNTYFRFDESSSKPRVNFMKPRLIRKFLMASS